VVDAAGVLGASFFAGAAFFSAGGVLFFFASARESVW